MNKFVIKNDNKIKAFKSGLMKDNGDEKIRFDLIPYQLLERIAFHFTRGAKKYGVDNWKKASNEEEEHIFLEAALRHILKWSSKIEDGEDHASAAITNIIMYEYHTKHKIKYEDN